MTHKAKVDWWIVAALGMGVLGPFAGFGFWLTVPLFLAVGICGYPQYYQTGEHGLVIYSGLVRRTIPYESILFAGPATESGSALTVSLERVRIEYGRGAHTLIAPADREEFLRDLAARAKQLTRRGPDLVLAFV